MKEYFKPKKYKIIIGTILAALFVVFLVVGIKQTDTNSKNTISFDPVINQDDKDVYIDIVGVSGYYGKDESGKYYSIAFDGEYLYIIRLTDSVYNDLEEQLDYFEYEVGEQPAPKRVFGKSFEIDSELFEYLMGRFGLESEDEFHDYFGGYVFDATASTGQDSEVLFFLLSFVALVICFIMFLSVIKYYSNYNKCIKELSDEDIAEAKLSLESIDGNTDVAVTNNYLFDFKKGGIIKYENILWTYVSYVSDRAIPVILPGWFYVSTKRKAVLMINTKTIKKYSVDVAYKDFIDEKTPYCLKGYNKDNRKEYKELCKNHQLVDM